MKTSVRMIATGLTTLFVFTLLLCGCQQKEPAATAPQEKSESQLDTEYRALLAEIGLSSGGAVVPPAQIEAQRYGQLLLVAAGHGSTEMLTRLLDAAAATLHATNCDLLLERGLDPDAKDDLGRTQLHLVVAQPSGCELARLLLSRGARVDTRDEQGMTPLLLAGPNCVKLLVDKGSDLSAQDNLGNSALHWAVYRKSYELAGSLMAQGVPLDIQDSAGKTPLHHAVLLRDAKMVQMLLKAGAKSDVADTQGQAPRQAAEKSGNKVIMDLFKLP